MELEYDFFPLIAGELGASRDSSKQLQSRLDEFLPVYKVHVIAGWLIAPNGTVSRGAKLLCSEWNWGKQNMFLPFAL